MWFFGLLILVFFIALVTLFIGRQIVDIIFGASSVNSAEAWAVSALAGSGIVMSLFGWLSFSGVIGRFAGPITVGVLLLAAALFEAGSRRKPGRTRRPVCINSFSGWLLLAGCAGAILVLLPIGLYQAFNPYNDTVTYITISDYLQNHSFAFPADPNPTSPLLGHVVIYQVLGFRMGANFFLACVQSLTPVKLAIEIFPAVAAWAVVLNVFAVYLGCRWIALLPRRAALAGALLAAVMVNPLHYAAQTGFFPQLFGTAFTVFSLALAARCVRTRRPAIGLILLASAAFAFLISAYSELFPLVAIAVALMFGLRTAMRPARLTGLLRTCTILLPLTSLFANIELIRMINALPRQLHGVVGWHIYFTSLQYYGASVGLFPGGSPNNYWAGHLGAKLYPAVALLSLGLFVYGLFRVMIRDRVRGFALLPVLGTFALLFIYFRFIVKDPWLPAQTGHSWSLFKLSQWVYPFMIMPLLAAGLAITRWHNLLSNFAIAVGLLSLPLHISSDRHTIMPVRQMTLSNRPFQAYTQFAQAARRQAAGMPIELRGGMDGKHRQLLVYFLDTYPVIANWRDDGTVYPLLKPENRDIRLKEAHLILAAADNYSAVLKRMPAGVMVAEPDIALELQFQDDWYPAEVSGNSTWQWSSGNSTVKAVSGKDHVFLMNGEYLCANNAGFVSVTLNGLHTASISCTERGVHTLSLIPLYLGKGENEIRFQTDTPPMLALHDARPLAFQLRNFDLKPE
jgi:hypothetical protein